MTATFFYPSWYSNIETGLKIYWQQQMTSKEFTTHSITLHLEEEFEQNVIGVSNTCDPPLGPM